MVDRIHAAFVFVFVVSTSSAIKCHIYFRRGKSPPKINETDDCESNNRHLYQMKGCDADDIQDNMLIYIPSLSGKSWENIMEACLN
ncbi:unnamed protein product [Onchocerca flexuosa]|uniref:Secreted protein n=1 Tax=Onchocerca flexuosa TaxID=387005 RepID=A0A183HHK8_9BILA|nr:unnamed protein product [Onchocerca flexuosa]